MDLEDSVQAENTLAAISKAAYVSGLPPTAKAIFSYLLMQADYRGMTELPEDEILTLFEISSNLLRRYRGAIKDAGFADVVLRRGQIVFALRLEWIAYLRAASGEEIARPARTCGEIARGARTGEDGEIARGARTSDNSAHGARTIDNGARTDGDSSDEGQSAPDAHKCASHREIARPARTPLEGERELINTPTGEQVSPSLPARGRAASELKTERPRWPVDPSIRQPSPDEVRASAALLHDREVGVRVPEPLTFLAEHMPFDELLRQVMAWRRNTAARGAGLLVTQCREYLARPDVMAAPELDDRDRATGLYCRHARPAGVEDCEEPAGPEEPYGDDAAAGGVVCAEQEPGEAESPRAPGIFRGQFEGEASVNLPPKTVEEAVLAAQEGAAAAADAPDAQPALDGSKPADPPRPDAELRGQTPAGETRDLPPNPAPVPVPAGPGWDRWQLCSDLLRCQMTRPTYDSTVRGCRAWLDGEALILLAPTDQARAWLDLRLKGLVERTAATVAGRPAVRVRFACEGGAAC